MTNKKLFVPQHVARAAEKAIKGAEAMPKPIENAFGKGAKSKNTDDPSEMEQSSLERLPQPTGYRVLIIPYYPSEKTKGGIIVPDSVRERESFATVAAYVVKLGPGFLQEDIVEIGLKWKVLRLES